ncbi:MAG TPA: PRC-barrel domain-containing protein [Thermodesulfobacteriota bacterium]|nr:PRC-barrel domain-containing protein [Thermodesulfobacteriota bacterium]
MKKMITSVLAVLTMVAFAHMSPVYAAGMDKGQSDRGNMSQSQTQGRMDTREQQMMMGHHELSDLMGKEVKGMNNEDLGKIKDFVTDARGRLEFAILSTGMIAGKTIAVPFHALHYQGTQGHENFTLNMTKDQLDKAPEYNKSDLTNRQWAQNVYRYFGMQSRWSEEGKRPMTGESRREGNRSDMGTRSGSSYGTQSDTGTQSGTTR